MSEIERLKDAWQKAAFGKVRNMAKAKAKQSIKAGWVNAEPGDVVELTPEQFDALERHHPGGMEWVTDATPAPEFDVDEPAEDEAVAARKGIPGAPPEAKDRKARRSRSIEK